MKYQNYRQRDASETLAWVQPHLKTMGITRLANVTGLDNIGIPVYVAVRPNAKSLSVSQGKGINANNAKASALMESIEFFHAENLNLETFAFSFSEAKDQAYDLCDFEGLPIRKDTDFPNGDLQWVLAQDIFNKNNNLFVPKNMVNMDLRLGYEHANNRYFLSSTNGLASGNTMMEAKVHALCELIERDSYALWSLRSGAQKGSTKMDITTIDNPECRELIDMFVKADVLVGIWDVTSDLGVPCFLVRILPDTSPPFSQVRAASGFGCHPDKHLALIRALTEAAQSRLTHISGTRDDMLSSHYKKYLSEGEYGHWYQSIEGTQGRRSYQDIDSIAAIDTDGIWDKLTHIIRLAGVTELLFLDLTKKEFGIPVCKLIAPGLESNLGYDVMKAGSRARTILNRPEKEALCA